MELQVNFGGLTAVAAEVTGYGNTISSLHSAVEDVKRTCAVQGKGKSGVIANLGKIMSSMENEYGAAKRLGESLETIADTYKQAEQNISGNQRDETNEKKSLFSLSDFWKMVSNVGIIGQGTALVGDLITGKHDLKSLIGDGKYLLSMIGGVATVVSKGGTSTAWKEYLFGLNNALSGIDTSSAGNAFWSSVQKQLGSDLSFKAATDVGAKVKVATKWGGHLLTLAKNGVENYQEYKDGDISAARAVAETGIETVVDIGLGVAATAGVTAAAVALGVTAAPALVTGAIATGAVIAANSVCKWATGGKDIGEVVADGICDVAESAGKAVGKAASKVGKAWKNIKKSTSKITTSWSKWVFA